MFNRESVVFLKSLKKNAILSELVSVACRSGDVTSEEKLRQAILDREMECTTGIGMGIAVPHARVDCVKRPVIVFGRVSQPVEFEALDGNLVSIVVLIAVPCNTHKDYIRILARIANFLKDDQIRRRIMAVEDEDQLLALLRYVN